MDSTNAAAAWAATETVERMPGVYTASAQDARAVFLIGGRRGLKACPFRTQPHGPMLAIYAAHFDGISARDEHAARLAYAARRVFHSLDLATATTVLAEAINDSRLSTTWEGACDRAERIRDILLEHSDAATVIRALDATATALVRP